jgi:tetratricopeptide (TPR) repeat protein
VTLSQAFGGFLILCMLAGTGWLFVHLLKLSDDPAKILFKAALTLGIVVLVGVFIGPNLWSQSGALIGIPLSAVAGVVIAILWRQHIGNLMARPFENLFTGGSRPPDPEPFYSIARTRRQQQRFEEAIEEIHAQLERFPDDFEGLLMIAEIQAVDQQNLSGAAETINRVCLAHSGSPGRVFSALCTLADWQLQIAGNRDAALACFERVKAMFPHHPVALDAEQRIAHLPSQEMLDARSSPRTIALKEMPQVVIRDPSEVKVELKAESPDEAIGRLLNQLEVHPQDRTAREELAGLYADHLRDARLAVEQLDLLVKQPGHDKQNVVKWFNRMADYYIQIAGDVESARTALERIERRYPNSPAAAQAGRRKMLLGRELKGNEKGREVSLGSYERDLGLRGEKRTT